MSNSTFARIGIRDGDVSPGRSRVAARESEGIEESGVSTSDWENSEKVA
jgi:hypothetical protein